MKKYSVTNNKENLPSIIIDADEVKIESNLIIFIKRIVGGGYEIVATFSLKDFYFIKT